MCTTRKRRYYLWSDVRGLAGLLSEEDHVRPCKTKAVNACPVCWTSVSLQGLIDNHSIAVKTIIGIWATDFHHTTHTCENIAKLLICKMLSRITRSYYRHVFHSPIFVRHIKTRNAFRCVIMVTDGFNNNPHGGLSHIVWRYVTIISDLRALGGMMSYG